MGLVTGSNVKVLDTVQDRTVTVHELAVPESARKNDWPAQHMACACDLSCQSETGRFRIAAVLPGLGSSEKSPPDIYPPGYRERLRRSKDFSQVRRVLCVKDVASRVQLWCVVYNTVMILVRACRRREVLECSPCTLRESGSLRG